MDSSSRKRALRDFLFHEDVQQRPKYDYDIEEMREDLTKVLLTLFCQAGPLEEYSETDCKTVAKKTKSVVKNADFSDWTNLPEPCWECVVSYLAPYEMDSLFTTCKVAHSFKFKFQKVRLNAVLRYFFILSTQAKALSKRVQSGRIVGGWERLIRFFTEASRRLFISYRNSFPFVAQVPAVHRGLVGDRILAALVGGSCMLGPLSFHQRCAAGEVRQLRFSRIFALSLFETPQVLLGDEQYDPSSGAEYSYPALPFLQVSDHCGGWDYHILLEPTLEEDGQFRMHYWSDGSGGQQDHNLEMFGPSWPCLAAYFCLDSYRNASYAEGPVTDWQLSSVAWLMARGIAPFDGRYEHIVGLIPWDDLLDHLEENDTDDDDDDDEDPLESDGSRARFETIAFCRRALNGEYEVVTDTSPFFAAKASTP